MQCSKIITDPPICTNLTSSCQQSPTKIQAWSVTYRKDNFLVTLTWRKEIIEYALKMVIRIESLFDNFALIISILVADPTLDRYISTSLLPCITNAVSSRYTSLVVHRNLITKYFMNCEVLITAAHNLLVHFHAR